jgi:hypothetical protein
VHGICSTSSKIRNVQNLKGRDEIIWETWALMVGKY